MILVIIIMFSIYSLRKQQIFMSHDNKLDIQRDPNIAIEVNYNLDTTIDLRAKSDTVYNGSIVLLIDRSVCTYLPR